MNAIGLKRNVPRMERWQKDVVHTIKEADDPKKYDVITQSNPESKDRSCVEEEVVRGDRRRDSSFEG